LQSSSRCCLEPNYYESNTKPTTQTPTYRLSTYFSPTQLSGTGSHDTDLPCFPLFFSFFPFSFFSPVILIDERSRTKWDEDDTDFAMMIPPTHLPFSLSFLFLLLCLFLRLCYLMSLFLRWGFWRLGWEVAFVDRNEMGGEGTRMGGEIPDSLPCLLASSLLL